MQPKPPEDHPTLLAHRHQFAWHILVPFLIMAGLIITGAVLVVRGGSTVTGVWADISLIWLLVPAIFIALVLLVISITIIYGMAKLLHVIPTFTGKAQGLFSMLSAGSRKLADGATKPFIWFRQAGAAIKSILRF
jgi:hypothetical protein